MSNHVTVPSCIPMGSNVTIEFFIDRPNPMDIVAVFPMDSVNKSNSISMEGENLCVKEWMPSPLHRNWIRTCGSQTCKYSTKEEIKSQGMLHFDFTQFDGSKKWIAVVARPGNDQDQPLKLLATSQVFSSCKPQLSNSNTASSIWSNTQRHLALRTISTNKVSYAFDEDIKITFRIDDARRGDWVVIFDAKTKINSQAKGLFWMWLGCKRQGSLNDCPSRNGGSLTIGKTTKSSWKSNWPPLPGRYIAVVLRKGDKRPWNPVAISKQFRVRSPPKTIKSEIQLVRRKIGQLIKDDISLAAKFLRLAFHDSVGGPDGCVDLTDIHNRGLKPIMDALQPIVKMHKGNLTRGDVWALAAMVGAEISQPRKASFRADFALTEIGRINCENSNKVCRNKDGVSHGCRSNRGPFREIPGANTNTHELFSFFKKEYGFNMQETVAIMGAHTIGQIHKNNSGIDGTDGWVLNNRRLDNEYYKELVGGRSVQSKMSNLINMAPNWKRHFENNPESSPHDDINVWMGLPEGPDGRVIIMLSADISLARNLDRKNMNSKTGKVSCQFVERSGDDPVCPQAMGSIRQLARYKHDNDLWIKDFEKVMRKMINAKYKITTNCDGGICKLRKL